MKNKLLMNKKTMMMKGKILIVKAMKKLNEIEIP